MRQVRRAVGSRIPVESYDDSTWDGGGDTLAMEHLVRKDWSLDLKNDLPVKGRPAEMSSDRMPGRSGNEDGSAGALLCNGMYLTLW